MLHPFISARAVGPSPRGAGGIAASMALHAGVAALAVAATAPDFSRVERPRAPTEHVVFTGIRPVEPVRAATGATSRPARTRRGRGLARNAARAAARVPEIRDLANVVAFTEEMFAAALDAVHVDVPQLDLVEKASGGIEFTEDALQQFSGRVRAVPRPNAGDAYTEDVVEKVVAPYGNNPRPRYPGQLQAAEIEGSFVVKFVVDTLGHVAKGSLVFPGRTHGLFVKSVRDALLRSRFLPAELGGRRVPQLVQQRFSFVMETIGSR